MSGFLKSGKFWGGVITGVVLLSFFPHINPRAALARPKKG